MKATEIRRDFEYKDAELPSGITVSGIVITKNGKLYGTSGSITAKYPNKTSFKFRMYQENSPDPVYNELLGDVGTILVDTSKVREGIDSNTVIAEFKEFITTDLSLTE